MNYLSKNRQILNTQQSLLRKKLTSKAQQVEGLDLFLVQHSMLHTGSITENQRWSYEDAVFEGLTEENIRKCTGKNGHSIAWLIWHLSRIEDVTMNLLVAGTSQRFTLGDWKRKLKVAFNDTGNGMSAEMVQELSKQVDITQLRAYRQVVGKRTRKIVKNLDPEILTELVRPERLERILDEKAVLPAGLSVIEYWGRRDIAGLLLMPPTRHCIVHLNEAYKLKKKLCK